MNPCVAGLDYFFFFRLVEGREKKHCVHHRGRFCIVSFLFFCYAWVLPSLVEQSWWGVRRLVSVEWSRVGTRLDGMGWGRGVFGIGWMVIFRMGEGRERD